VDILNHTLQQAINQRASDIHIEPMEHACQIRLRIDGVLCPQPPLAAERWQPVQRTFKSAG
jgi:protein transport protein HofB